MNLKKAGILVVLILAPAISLLLPGCEDGRSVYEIIGQETHAQQEGKYSGVLIQIRYDVKRISFDQDRLFPLTAPLLATSPAPPDFRTPVSQIEIVADVDFDNTHLQGSDLRDIFDVLENPASTFPLQGSMKPGEDFSLYLKLKHPPANDLIARLTITSSLANGISFTSEVTSIAITK